MKKLMFVAAVAAAMTGLADVTSANVVGYQNVTELKGTSGVSQTPNMLAIPFAGIEADKGMPVSALQVKGIAMGEDCYDCDFIEIWDLEAGSANVYYYDMAVDDWLNAAGYEYMSVDYEDGIPAGSAMWYTAWSTGDRGGEALSITFSGAVEGQPDVTFYPQGTSGVSQTPNMLGNPYPVAWLPGENCIITGVAQGEDCYDCDFIEIWDLEAGSANVYYYDMAVSDWLNAAGYEYMSVDYENGVPVGSAFWYTAWSTGDRGGETLSIKFISPFAPAE